MVHLVTGYAGEEHITSADQGSYNAAFFGDGQFIAESGNKMKASIVSNNLVRILDGDALMYGRHVRIAPGEYEDMTIQNGTSQTKRIDLIVLTYEKDTSNGVETAYLEVIRGAETTGTPTVPSYTAGNILDGATKNQMPLYKCNINGVVLESVVLACALLPTYKTLAERYAAQFEEACRTYLDSLNILDSKTGIMNNTTSNQLAGALGVKAIANDKQDKSTAITTSNIGSQTVAKANAVAWSGVTGKPSTYAPSSHTHDERYYTEAEVNALIANERIPVGGYFVGVQAPNYGTWTSVGTQFTIGNNVSGSLKVNETSTSIARGISLYKRTA